MAKKDKKKEDEYKEENLENSSAQDDEDFGLPDLDEDFDADDDKDEIVVEETVQDELVTLEDEDDSAEESTFDTGETSEPVTFESHEEEEVIEEEYEDDDYETEDEEAPVGTYVPPKQSSAPIIITISIIIILACVAVWFFFIKDSKPEPVVEKPVKDTTTYVVEKPVEVEEPVIEEPVKEEATINTLNSRTGRSYVVVGSFFDDDLAMDYAKELKKDGNSAYIIPPFGKSKFTRVAIAETTSFAEASSRATELAGQFKEQPWPLKY
jgi:cell division septation protein DedD